MSIALAQKEKVELSLAAPANGTVITAPASLTLSATARAALLPAAAAEHALNNPQAIATVEFFAGTTLLGTITGPRADNAYSFNWVNPAPGVYSISARASNGKGDSATSGAVSVTVNAPPTVSLSTPAAVVTAPGTISLKAAPADLDGTIQKVDFFRGTTLIGTVTAAPFAFELQNQPAGTYAFTARVTDNYGAIGESGSVTVLVNEPPTAALSVPAAVVTAPGNITLTASAADTDGTIQKVDFFAGSALIGTSATAPYTLLLEQLAPGIYTFTARPTDNYGASTTSNSVTVTVNAPPTVALSTPAAVVTAPGTIALTASPADTDGTIQKVDFFRGTTLLGTATASPYQLELADLPSGTYTFTAVASDNHAATGSSAAVTVRVNSAPTVTLTSTATSFRAPASIPLTALVLDTDGAIAKVELFNGSELIATLTADPFSATWSQVPQGTYALTALVTDDLGASVSSSPIVINVSAAQAKLYFVHVDHLNTPRLVSDQQHRVVWRWDHGEPFGATPPDDNPEKLTRFNYPIRISAGYADEETGTIQTHFRDIDLALGRFVQSDPVGLLGGINTYAYVANSPLRRTDPTGLAYFAQRSLSWMPRNLMFTAAFLGPWNVAHEHIFFEDGKTPSNIGFGADGLYSEFITFDYKTTIGGFNDCIMRIAVATTPVPPYNFLCSNCQHWARDVREQYAILAKDPAVLQRCNCEPQTQTATSAVTSTNQSKNAAAASTMALLIGAAILLAAFAF